MNNRRARRETPADKLVDTTVQLSINRGGIHKLEQFARTRHGWIVSQRTEDTHEEKSFNSPINHNCLNLPVSQNIPDITYNPGGYYA